jgi:hypothetical protein
MAAVAGTNNRLLPRGRRSSSRSIRRFYAALSQTEPREAFRPETSSIHGLSVTVVVASESIRPGANSAHFIAPQGDRLRGRVLAEAAALMCAPRKGPSICSHQTNY